MSNKVSFLDLRKINARFSDDFHEDLSRVLKRGWYLRGEATAQFEQSFAKYCGVEHWPLRANTILSSRLLINPRGNHQKSAH